MPATPSLTLPAAGPRVFSAGDLCKAMRATRPALPDASGLDRILRHDAERGLLEVQSATPWSALAAHTGGAFASGTVGEAVAANAAGPDGQPMVAHVRSITVATADGELRRASRERAPELFRLAVGGFGAVGPFYSVTLELGSLARSLARATPPLRLDLPAPAPAGARFRIELLLPPQASEGFVAQARAALDERRCRLARLEARPTLPEEATFLRWAQREYAALFIEFRTRDTVGGCVNGSQLRARLVELAIAAGGSLSPQYLPHATRAQAAHCYPMLGAFLAEKRRYDPAERVADAWYRAVRDLWRRESCAVRWSRDQAGGALAPGAPLA
ncbi:MAG TPA: FAD-binding protein [Burkholderiales bacterium]|nr:FAD-binding protein [Burkholderiales bacterium]